VHVLHKLPKFSLLTVSNVFTSVLLEGVGWASDVYYVRTRKGSSATSEDT
jgi:hypothetical protein